MTETTKVCFLPLLLVDGRWVGGSAHRGRVESWAGDVPRPEWCARETGQGLLATERFSLEVTYTAFSFTACCPHLPGAPGSANLHARRALEIPGEAILLLKSRKQENRNNNESIANGRNTAFNEPLLCVTERLAPFGRGCG